MYVTAFARFVSLLMENAQHGENTSFYQQLKVVNSQWVVAKTFKKNCTTNNGRFPLKMHFNNISIGFFPIPLEKHRTKSTIWWFLSLIDKKVETRTFCLNLMINWITYWCNTHTESNTIISNNKNVNGLRNCDWF